MVYKIKIKKKKLQKAFSDSSNTDDINSNINAANSISDFERLKGHSSSKYGDEIAASVKEKDDLCDMIEKIQGDRLDNQRCELNQDYSVSL